MAREQKISARPLDFGHPNDPAQCPQTVGPISPIRRGPQRAESPCPDTPVRASSESLGCLDRRLIVKELMLADKTDACRSLSLEGLADRYSEQLGQRISPAILEKLYKPSVAIKNLAVADLPAWIETTNSFRILDWLASELGLSVARPSEQRSQRIGEAYERMRVARADLERAFEEAA